MLTRGVHGELYKMPRYSATRKQCTAHSDSSDDPISAIFQLCAPHLPQKTLTQSSATFVQASTALHEAHEKIIKQIAREPFLAAFMVWIQEIKPLHVQIIPSVKLLFEERFIDILCKKKGVVVTIGDARDFDHKIIIEAIRCRRELPLLIREQLVTTYLSFIQWLSEETYGYISKLGDPDLMKVKDKVLPYGHFITFLDALKEKDQIVAKLLYYGGTPTLEEVLHVQIQDVDFAKKTIRFHAQTVSYPAHVFADIQAIINTRTHGKIFLSRQNASFSPSRIFRNFKEAAKQVGFAAPFSPAVLTSSH